MENLAQGILDRKIEQSCQEMRDQNSLHYVFSSFEIVGLLAVLGVFFSIVYFIFWGPGYSIYAKEQHDFTVSVLAELPGPHQALIEEAMENEGYVSLLDYRKYVDMANEFKINDHNRIKTSSSELSSTE